MVMSLSLKRMINRFLTSKLPSSQIFGPESSGKTSLALQAIASVQKQGGQALLVDAEHAFDPVYAKVCDPKGLIRTGVRL